MRKITSNKRGFTLTEIILVIAIIVILSAAVATGIAIDINRYNNYLENLKATGGTKWEADAREKADGMFPKYVTPDNTGEATLDTEETEESEDTEETEDTEDTKETKDTEETEGTKETEGTTESTQQTNVTNSTSGGGAAGSVTVGNLTASNGYVTPSDTCPAGVVKMDPDGTTVLNSGSKNTVTVKITKTPNGSYHMVTTNNEGRQWVISGLPHFNWGDWDVDLSADQKKDLEDAFGLKLA